MFTRIARTCLARRRLVVAVWAVLLVGALAASARFGGELRTDFALDGAPSQRAADLLAGEGFPAEAGQRGQVVIAADGGVNRPEVVAAARDLFGEIEASVPGVAVVSPFEADGGLVSPDGRVAIADVSFGDVDLGTASERADAIARLRASADLPAGVRVELGGDVFAEEPGFSSEGIGMAAALVILLVAFGSVVAAGLPVLTALVGIGVGSSIVLLAAHVLDVPDFAPAAVAMVTVGVGIDYALLIVTRYREELAAGRAVAGAVTRAVETAGRAVLFAGATVVVALLGLLLIGLPSTRSLAVAISAGVLVAMLASLTLVPALLGLLGRRIDRLAVRRRRTSGRGEGDAWLRWSRRVQRRPVAALVAGLALVMLLAAPVTSMRLGFADASNRPDGDTSRQAFDLVADAFGPGHNGPLVVAVDLTGDAETDGRVLARLASALDGAPGVAGVTAPLVAPAGGAAVVQAFPTTAPQAAETSNLVHRLRQDVLPDVQEPGTEILVGGSTAAAVDFADVQGGRMPLFIGAVLALSFVVLAAVFRGVPVALKAVVLNMLSIAAAYGVVVAVFQWGWGAGLLGVGEPGPIEAWAPMMLFAILFGLSMDYEVFLLSRIREEYDRTGDNAESVAAGLATTARLITAAAAIMVVVFGAFVLSPDRALQLFGVGLAVAILIDVTLVRLVLVPASMQLLGDRNWWLPAWTGRLLPDTRREPPVRDAEPLRPTPTLDADPHRHRR